MLVFVFTLQANVENFSTFTALVSFLFRIVTPPCSDSRCFASVFCFYPAQRLYDELVEIVANFFHNFDIPSLPMYEYLPTSTCELWNMIFYTAHHQRIYSFIATRRTFTPFSIYEIRICNSLFYHSSFRNFFESCIPKNVLYFLRFYDFQTRRTNS